jgi:hypothetical protein
MATRQSSLSSYHRLLHTTIHKISAVARRSRRTLAKRPRTEHTSAARAAPLLTKDPTVPDPVRIAVLAMERLGRASLRASTTGVEVRVAAPDDAMAAVFRAALAETARFRGTDRLIRVIVE